jgi:DNA-binding MarR family transcriptional regulator/N-acetylglutamate synthase-like GNAT family acetyltransferase
MDASAHVQAVRRFNRFYTTQIGVLQHEWLGSSFSLPEARVLYELAHHQQPTATDLGNALGVDAGYLSRMLRHLDQRGLVRRTRSADDGRRAHLSLTRTGQSAFARLNARTEEDVAARLGKLSTGDRRRLVQAMEIIEDVLAPSREVPRAYVLRPPRAGDLGWIVHRQGVLYAEEWGYNEEFEALVAEIVAAFVKKWRPSMERCWIAETDGEIVGSVFLVRQSRTVAKLRLLSVEPSARGMGIGSRLIDECVRFGRQAGYRKITLWTQSELDAARRLYQKAGFTLVSKKRHDSFGRKGLVAETWELAI